MSLATSLVDRELFFVHITSIPTSSKIIGILFWPLVLSLHKQLMFRCSGIERVEQQPLMMWTWNCIGGYSFYMANDFAHEQLKGTWSKFDVNKIGLNLEAVVIILKSIYFKLMASTSWLLGILMQNLQRDVAKSWLSCRHMISI